MKVKDYKIGDVPDMECSHSMNYIIRFAFKPKFGGVRENWKCIKCHKFTQEEKEVLRKQPQYYSKEFIDLLKLKD